MVIKHLNQIELADRWNISERTLERWRWTGEGLAFLKIGGRVRYRLEDIEAYESENIFEASADNSGDRVGAKQVSPPPQSIKK
ncbi:MAG: helix-turn-helix domain-containing protein [Planctomycetota bacterium]|nr:helix-turn-helix domain-containing protein [Planctomycetota bacterium]